MYHLFCRIYQLCFRLVSYVLPWRKPELLVGEHSLDRLPELIRSKGIDHVLIVTDKGIVAIGLLDGLLSGLKNSGVQYSIYDKTVANPTIDNIEEALALYQSTNCQGIAAFGGGSPMDCAKGVGARLARPNKTISQMKGILKVRKKLPPLFAIPTTAGTGSETTIAAVITDSRTHEKYAINDMALIPHYAVLDPLVTVGLPPHITATTGIDALTHAIEAYIGRSNTKETKDLSRQAVKLVFENVYEAYSNGTNRNARENMQMAAHYAGLAFTRAYVGYVHAIAHTLGGFYSTPHGLANAVILPYVLEYYEDAVYQPLAGLSDLVGISVPGDTEAQKSKKFIEAIKELNQSMKIPDKLSGIADGEISTMADRALKESNPLYPVPRILGKNDMLTLFAMIRE